MSKYQKALDDIAILLAHKGITEHMEQFDILQELIDRCDRPNIKALRCRCSGNKKQRIYRDGEVVALMCKKCGEIVYGKNLVDCINNWNKEMKNDQ